MGGPPYREAWASVAPLLFLRRGLLGGGLLGGRLLLRPGPGGGLLGGARGRLLGRGGLPGLGSRRLHRALGERRPPLTRERPPLHPHRVRPDHVIRPPA